MADVTRTAVPEISHLRNWDVSEVAHLAPVWQESDLTLGKHGLQLAAYFVGISVIHIPINCFDDAFAKRNSGFPANELFGQLIGRNPIIRTRGHIRQEFE